MSACLLVDTHIALWLESGDGQLSKATAALIDDHWRGGGVVHFSAISVWEIAMLMHRRRIKLRRPLEDWVARFLDLPGVDVIEITHRIAMRTYDFDPYDNGDPADRLLIATAIELDCPLVTYDRRILEFAKQHGGRHRFAAITD